MSHRALSLPLSAVLLVSAALVSACGKANPVAPSGSTITLSANPSEIPSPTGTSTITAVVRKPNGTVAAGVEVRFTASLGTIDVLAKTDSGGVATATLKGDGRTGTATVNATVDGGATAMALMVVIGGGGHTITLQAIPATIHASGGQVTLIAIVRDATGQPAVGAGVNFTTNLGRLASGGALVRTDANGQATDTLTLQATDISNQTSVSITAETAAADGSLQTATVMIAIGGGPQTITLQANPASIPASGGHVSLVAIVRDSTGQPAAGAGVNFTTNLGTLTSHGGLVFTNSSGQATDTLTLAATDVGNQTSISVSAETAMSNGTLVTSTITISILTNAAASIVAEANPTQLPLSGGTVNLTALVRNSSGGPVPGAGVNFTTTLGTLGSGGGILTTDKNGQVTDTLTIPPQSGPGPITVTVQAFTPGSGSNLISSNMVTITLK